ncbi:hypothetical protein ABPG72_014452 [Tetrahymena utriculariae]
MSDQRIRKLSLYVADYLGAKQSLEKYQEIEDCLDITLQTGNLSQFPQLIELIGDKIIKFDLEIWGNSLSDKNGEKLDEAFDYTPHLTHLSLRLRNNQISDPGCDCLGALFIKLTELVNFDLNLKSNLINDSGFLGLMFGFTSMTKLQTLAIDLEDNHIGDDAMEELSNSFSKLILLQDVTLNFWGNVIGDKGISMLGKGLQKLPLLTNLCLELMKNQIKDEGVISFAKNMVNFSRLKQLDISLWLSDQGAYSLGLALFLMDYLTSIKLNSLYNKSVILNKSVRGIKQKLQDILRIIVLNQQLSLIGISQERQQQYISDLIPQVYYK